MDWNEITIKTYDQSATGLAEYFKSVGARVDDIERSLKLAEASKSARVVEIGCGDGRDATEIVQRVGWYQGFDPSEGLLKLAHQKLPDVDFVKADALSFSYPKDVDVVYAFASLLHVKRGDLKPIFEKVAHALRPGGIFYISLKERDDYIEEPRTDQFGERMFYYYKPAIIQNILPAAFAKAYEDHQTIGKTPWFTIALKRK